ncbi:hypothetical protein [Fervidicoccus fontis]|uniref:tRNA intron endonuclease catalytic domain-containing protein n=1 Tax=Fervidicoccus fontis TaxID=683846 RepID=A0A7C2ZP63_9CREN|nr:hypothetical protein [Fervidicoccus fontis]HEW64276.1 hypothetical protein [Fervidicoccus fontis]
MKECTKAKYLREKRELVCYTGEKLDFYETAYMCKKGKIIITDEDQKTLEWYDIVLDRSQLENNAWILFSVYYDLRERGRILKYGPFQNSFTLYQNNKPISLVFVYEETFEFKVSTLLDLLDAAKRLNREAILAVVDKHGDVSYYTFEKFS